MQTTPTANRERPQIIFLSLKIELSYLGEMN